MRVFVDPTRCQGFGRCHEVCPEAFELDEWGFAQAVTAEVATELEASVHAAVAACPERAITTDGAGATGARAGG